MSQTKTVALFAKIALPQVILHLSCHNPMEHACAALDLSRPINYHYYYYYYQYKRSRHRKFGLKFRIRKKHEITRKITGRDRTSTDIIKKYEGIGTGKTNWKTCLEFAGQI